MQTVNNTAFRIKSTVDYGEESAVGLLVVTKDGVGDYIGKLNQSDAFESKQPEIKNQSRGDHAPSD